MFSLVVTIIAIALVALLALATLYYGGNFITDGQAKSQSTKAIQEGTQVLAAIELYKADKGSLPTGTNAQIQATLVSDGYLTTWPTTDWEVRNDYAVRTGLSEDACIKINSSFGITTPPPSCSDTNFTNRSVCCVN